MDVEPTLAAAGAARPHAVMVVQAPDGTRLRLVVEVRNTLVPRDVPGILENLERASDLLGGRATPLIASPHLSSPVRDALEAAGVSYVDATGNLRLVAEQPAIYLKDRGADSPPWRGPGRPRGTLRGVPAARVVRTLVDRSGSSTGATYRVVDFLDREALLSRGPRGEVDAVDWPRLLRRWSHDYESSSDHTITRCLQPRGLSVLVRDLPRLDGAMVYAEDVARAIDLLALREVDAGTNVLLAAPASRSVSDRGMTVEGVRYAAPSQVAADLLTGPGRNPSEGEELLTWVEHHGHEWRT